MRRAENSSAPQAAVPYSGIETALDRRQRRPPTSEECAMNRNHYIDRDEPRVGAGWKTAIAIVVIALLVAAGQKALRAAADAATAPGEASADSSPYFPSGQALQATEPVDMSKQSDVRSRR
jgi:hypothetical protein